ncbi:MAG: NAD(P)-dependent alcohol dehydrogenase [Candidatus Aminicenantes bacterium]|nr:MAG: NAD(P)-dependent alcohol dehydrogenase [Candidatus Aminicenantes bacterium]
MKAIVYRKFGSPDVLHLEEVEKPVPKDDEVSVRVHAASLNAYDWRHLRADPFFIRFMGAGLLRPKHNILGADIAGRVEAVGRNVTQFRPGEDVFGEGSYGGFAEFVCVDEKRVVPKPADLTFEEAAAVPMAGLTALQGLRDKGKIQAAQKVLINGASGGVGTFAVQIAKSFGTEVTGVCSTAKMDLVRSIGADHVIDYTQEDVTKNGQLYDLIFDIAAFRSISKYRRILAPGGRYVLAGGSMGRFFQLMLMSMTGVKNMGLMVANVNQKDLQFLIDLMKAGKVKSIIDKRYPLSETAEALRYLENGHARGKVVISV